MQLLDATQMNVFSPNASVPLMELLSQVSFKPLKGLIFKPTADSSIISALEGSI